MYKGHLAGMLCFGVVCWGLPAEAQEAGYGGRQRYLISRGPEEEQPVPDVLTLADGTHLEGYFVQHYSDRVVFYLKEDERFWVREEAPLSQVVAVARRQYLERDPLEPQLVEKAAKQPVHKEEVVSGVFTAARGRFTSWRLSFHSEVNKNLPYAEDATEYGRFNAESRFEQRSGGETHAHKVLARGYYYLYAPGTVNNREWLLIVVDVVESDRDVAPEQGWTTRVIPYEAFIVTFSKERDSFHLDWANIGELSWAPLTQMTFERSGSPPLPAVKTGERGRGEELEAGRTTLAGLEKPASAGKTSRHRPLSSWGKPITRWKR